MIRPNFNLTVLSRLETGRTVLYSLLVGALVGLAGGVLLQLLRLAQRFLLGLGYSPPELAALGGVLMSSEGISRWFLLLLLPLGLALLMQMAPHSSTEDSLGNEIESYHKPETPVLSWQEQSSRLLRGIGFWGLGVPIGRDGVFASLGGWIGQLSSQLGRLHGPEGRHVRIAGVAAALGLVLHAPLAAAVFMVEVLYRRFEFEFEALMPAVLASVTAYAVYGTIDGFAPLFENPELSAPGFALLPAFLFLGALGAGFGTLWVRVVLRLREIWVQIPGSRVLWAAVVGLLCALAILALPMVAGEGIGWLQLALRGFIEPTALGLLSFWKILTLLLIFGFGMGGGLLMPLVVLGGILGASLGAGLSLLLPQSPLDVASFALIGVGVLLASTTKTPVASALLVVAWGGDQLLLPLLVANTAAYALSGELSLYPQQVTRRRDSNAHVHDYLHEAVGQDAKSLQDLPTEEPHDLMHLLKDQPLKMLEGDTELLYRVRVPTAWVGLEIEHLPLAPYAVLVAILRENQVNIPRSYDVLCAEDQLVLVATSEDYAALMQSLNETSVDQPESAKNV